MESVGFFAVFFKIFFSWDKEWPRDKTGRIPGAVSSPSQPVLCCDQSCLPGLWGSSAAHCSHAVRGERLHPSRWESLLPPKNPNLSFHSSPCSWSQGTQRASSWTAAVPEQQELGCVCPKAVELESSTCLSWEIMRGNLCDTREKAKIKGEKKSPIRKPKCTTADVLLLVWVQSAGTDCF